MAAGLIIGAVILGAGILAAGGSKKKKPAAPGPEQVASALAEAEARGEIMVTDEGEVLPADPVVAEVANELAAAEAAGDVVVSDDGAVAEKVGPQSWTLPENWFAMFEVRPEDGTSLKELFDILRNSSDVYAVKEKAGVISFVSADEEPSLFTLGEKLIPELPATLVNITLLSEAEFRKLAGKELKKSWHLPGNWFALFTVMPTSGSPQELVRGLVKVPDVRVVGVDAQGAVSFVATDEEEVTLTEGQQFPRGLSAALVNVKLLTPEEADAMASGTYEETSGASQVAEQIAEAEARGEIAVTEAGEIVEAAPVEAVAQELADAEARGEITVSNSGEVTQADPVAQELAEAEARGEIAVTESGDVVELAGADAAAQDLADLLVAAEQQLGGLWKVANQAEVQAWQIQQGVDYKGKALKPDGEFGRVGALTLASLGVDVIPIVRYWPVGSNQQTAVTQYKIDLQSLKTANPEAVRVALLRERGQGFGKTVAIRPSEQAG